jgi:hypothetical protein
VRGRRGGYAAHAVMVGGTVIRDEIDVGFQASVLSVIGIG